MFLFVTLENGNRKTGVAFLVDVLEQLNNLTVIFRENKSLQLTPWSSPFWEANIITQLVKKFPAFYGTLRFITMFIRQCCYQILRPHTYKSEHIRAGWEMIIWPQFCALQRQHLHQIPENLSITVNRTTCRINLVLTVNHKVKVKLPMCLTKHHAMKAYWGVKV
jgi:hypothetical protein